MEACTPSQNHNTKRAILSVATCETTAKLPKKKKRLLRGTRIDMAALVDTDMIIGDNAAPMDMEIDIVELLPTGYLELLLDEDDVDECFDSVCVQNTDSSGSGDEWWDLIIDQIIDDQPDHQMRAVTET